MAAIKEKGLKGLKVLIISRGYSQEMLAAEMGISKYSLNKKLNGKGQFTVSEAMKLVDILQIENPGRYFFKLEEV